MLGKITQVMSTVTFSECVYLIVYFWASRVFFLFFCPMKWEVSCCIGFADHEITYLIWFCVSSRPLHSASANDFQTNSGVKEEAAARSLPPVPVSESPVCCSSERPSREQINHANDGSGQCVSVIYRMFDSLRLDARLLGASGVFQKAWDCGWCDVIFKSVLSSRQRQVSNEPHHLVWPPDWATGVWLMKRVRTINEGPFKCATANTPIISLKITEKLCWSVQFLFFLILIIRQILRKDVHSLLMYLKEFLSWQRDGGFSWIALVFEFADVTLMIRYEV